MDLPHNFETVAPPLLPTGAAIKFWNLYNLDCVNSDVILLPIGSLHIKQQCTTACSTWKSNNKLGLMHAYKGQHMYD